MEQVQVENMSDFCNYLIMVLANFESPAEPFFLKVYFSSKPNNKFQKFGVPINLY